MKTLWCSRAIAAVSVLFAVAAQAAHEPMVLKPVKVTAAEAGSSIFSSPSAFKEKGAEGSTTTVTLLKSLDGKFEAGLYEAGPSDVAIESYSDDEFMLFLDGGVKLTSSDGSVLDVRKGEAVVIPHGWKGRWTTSGYKKYYVTYSHSDSSP